MEYVCRAETDKLYSYIMPIGTKLILDTQNCTMYHNCSCTYTCKQVAYACLHFPSKALQHNLATQSPGRTCIVSYQHRSFRSTHGMCCFRCCCEPHFLCPLARAHKNGRLEEECVTICKIPTSRNLLPILKIVTRTHSCT